MEMFQTAQGGDSLPLAGHPLFSSDDLDEARDSVARVYCDHRLEVMGKHRFMARHNRLSGSALSINVMTYNAKTLIAPGALERFYLFQLPIRGHASISNGETRYEIGGGSSGVLNPDAETCMIWSEDCVQVMLQIEKRALMETARAELGLPSGAPLRFSGSNDMRGAQGRSFLGLLQYVMAEAARGGIVLGDGSLLGKQLERTLMAGLLQTQSHGLPIACEGRGPMTRTVRRAEGFMRENLRSPIMIEDIARAAGTSTRAVQTAFRDRYGRSPMAFLRDLRLERAWEELSNPSQQTSVTNVATDLGFFHLGRFAEQYRKKFGCTPVETLRAALR
ncbi:AraC family transcriptional regulator [Thalassovita aquimarina]|uniref:AraC family transcriptional regulator n=1 Tax=Thalassovita aquimarina TaxID=2785917 RepID=A0ABS5HRJ1_9RHOB|nr:AraC family transcriptional regulator [Thalassovita aquimarina]MBR9651571.1 AraC family transcriptional regulator [Thalassovita aquimarina]